MEISKVELFPVSLPLKHPYSISGGPVKTLDHLVVKIHTTEGIVGLGEASPLPQYSDETQEGIIIALRKYLVPAILGQDPLEISSILGRMESVISGHSFAKTAIDIALWDIAGKAMKSPVYRLLGGLCRDRISLTWCIGMGTTEDMVKEALDSVEKGFTTIKIKIGRNAKKDIQNVAAIRDAIGDGCCIRVDANQGYTRDVAIRTLKKMESYDLQLIEQPVNRFDLDGMADIARTLDTPILADESVFSPSDAIRVIRKEAADAINIKIMKPGGLANSTKIANIAEAAGIPCLVGSNLEMGVAITAGGHFAAATSNITYESDLVSPVMYLVADDVLKEPYRLDGSFFVVPKDFGLGVEVDQEKLEKYRSKGLYPEVFESNRA
jgi:muconate/chloromuconate cycloisomerase